MDNIEILSPAGDEKSFFSAINNGANAIYLGLQNFNARNKAQNFNLDNLGYFVNIAHINNVKIYVVVNTLITDEEMPELLKVVEGSINCKVDAFIVQDLGVATLLKNTFKGINLHASTQMGIHSLQGAKVAEKLGFSRIVLSREVTEQDIKDIKNNTNLEIEYFVHGALCVSFSGNCYLSSLCSNESGNRGKCLQPCRLKYSSFSNGNMLKNGYLLSANDLCFIDKINTLKECGVTSFKIEGRLRRPSYVAYVTKMYSLACNSNYNRSALQAELRLKNFKKLFNRGEYNTGFYLNGEPNKNTINLNFQNHRGIEIGIVKNVKNFKDIYEILIKTNGYEINKNDGIKFIFNGTEQSLGVGSVNKTLNKNEYIIYTKVKPKIASKVFLTVDSKWEEDLLIQTKKIKFYANFIAKQNKQAKLILTARNKSINVETKEVLQQAKTSGLTQEEVKENLLKTKDTFFELDDLTSDIECVFMPKSMLNELRREGLEKLQNELIKSYEEKNIKPIEIDYSFYESVYKNKTNNIKELALNSNSQNNKVDNDINTKFICFNEYTSSDEINKHLNKNANLVYSPTNFNKDSVILALKNLMSKYNLYKVYLNLPKVLRHEDYIVVDEIIKSFDKNSLGLVANNVGHILFANFGYEVVGGAYLNVTNTISALTLKSFNIKTFTKSFEHFSSLTLGLDFVGKVELMTFCHCPYKTNFDNFSCGNCKFNNSLKISAENGKSYFVRRTKVKNCMFELIDSNITNRDKINNSCVFLDLRN